MKNQKSTRWNNIVFAVMKGCVVLGAVWLTGSAVTAVMLGAQILALKSVGYAIVLIMILSSFLCGNIMIKGMGGNVAWAAALSAVITLAMLLVANKAVGNSEVIGMPQTVLLILAGAGCNLLIKRKKKIRRRPMRNR